MPMATARFSRHLHRRVLMGSAAAFTLALAAGGGARAQTNDARTRNYTPDADRMRSVVTEARRNYIQQQSPGNNIVTDGQTQTYLRVNGNTTDIYTTTFSGSNAYNSFNYFTVGEKNTVNLIVPTKADQLVNIVRLGAVDIRGVLNSFQNGTLGGRVVFADSYGFIVGPSGVVNVGSLTVVTPKKEILDQVISGGKVDEALAARIISGDVPISPDGAVVISGKVKADNKIAITAADVKIAGSLEAAQRAAQQKAQFVSTVNMKGWDGGRGELVARNGKFSIGGGPDEVAASGGKRTASAPAQPQGNSIKIAAKKVEISGTISADPNAGLSGEISIKSQDTIDITRSAVLNASGVGEKSNGGKIEIKAGTNLSVEDYARFSARGGASGDGGFVELSAVGTVRLGNAIVVDLGADNGRAGTLLIDPTDIVVGTDLNGGTAPNGATNQANLITNGANVILQATNSIIVAGNGLIDTRSANNAGNITLEAAHIKLLGGAKLDASGTNGGRGGQIQLTATSSNNSNGASIDVGDSSNKIVTISGHDVQLKATANLGTNKATINIRNAQITAAGDLIIAAAASATSRQTLPVAVATLDVEASIDVGAGAVLKSAGKMDLISTAQATADLSASNPVGFFASADAAVAVATVKSAAKVHVGNTASLTTDGALTLSANNTVSSKANADASAFGSSAAGMSVGVNVVTATTTVLVDGDALITAQSVDAKANADVSLITIAKAAAGGAATPGAESFGGKYLSSSDSNAAGAKYAQYQKTSDGAVTVAGALAIADLSTDTSVKFTSSRTAKVTDAFTVEAKGKIASDVLASGASANGTGVGAALALNLVKISNVARIDQGVEAGSLSVAALMDGSEEDNLFSTKAVSGAAGKNVGVAGGLSQTLFDSQSLAQIGARGVITLSDGALTLNASNYSTIKTDASPFVTAAAGGEVGVGASLALTIAATRTLATFEDGAKVTGASDVTLDAISKGDVSFTTLNADGALQLTSTDGALSGTTANFNGDGSLQAKGDVSITSGSSGTSKGDGSFNKNGSLTISSSDGNISARNANFTTGVDFTAKALEGDVDLGPVTAGGKITILAKKKILFTNLAADGGIDVTAQTQGINGTQILFGGNSKLTAGGDIIVPTAKDKAGSPASLTVLSTGGKIDLTTVTVGKQFSAQADQGEVKLDTVTTGGSTTVTAKNKISYVSLKTTGANGDQGDITLTSTGADVEGTSSESSGTTKMSAKGIKADTLHATIDIDLSSSVTIDVRDVQSGGLTKLIATENVQVTTLSADRLEATADNKIIIDDSVIGRSITFTAKEVALKDVTQTASDKGALVMNVTAPTFTFHDIVAEGGLDLTSSGSISGNTVKSPRDISIDVGGSLSINNFEASVVALASRFDLTLKSVLVEKSAKLAATNINVDLLRQKAGQTKPLELSSTGYKNSIGTTTKISSDAPNGLNILTLKAVDAELPTTTSNVKIKDAFIDHTMRLTTPAQVVWADNWVSSPVLGNDIQIYQQSKRFTFEIEGYIVDGTAYVVEYGLKAKSRNEMVGAKYQGFNFVRDIDRLQRIGDATSTYWIEPQPKVAVPAVVERPSPPQISNFAKPIERSAPTALRETLPVNLDALFGVTLAPPTADDAGRRRQRELQVEPQ